MKPVIIDHNYNVEVHTEDNVFLMYANRLHNEGLDSWQGWQCRAGVNMLLIDFDGSVYGGECENDYLGNINTEFNLIKDHTICKKANCTGCTNDLKIEKFQ